MNNGKRKEIIHRLFQEKPGEDKNLIEFLHLLLTFGIEQAENHGNNELLLSFFKNPMRIFLSEFNPFETEGLQEWLLRRYRANRDLIINLTNMENKKTIERMNNIQAMAKEYIRLTSKVAIIGVGKNTRIESNKKTPIKLDNRDVNFNKFFIEYRKEIKEIEEENRKIKRHSQRKSSRNPYKGTKRVGLGIDSQIKDTKIKSSDVKIDTNTDPEKSKKEKYILYAPGWSLKPDEEH